MARATIKNVKNEASRQGNLIARLLPTSFTQSSSAQVNGRVKIRYVLFLHVSLAQLEMAPSHNTQNSRRYSATNRADTACGSQNRHEADHSRSRARR